MLHKIWEFALQQANGNPFFQGGAMAAALGFGIAWLRGLPGWCWGQIRKWILVSGKINNTDDVWGYQKLWVWKNQHRFWSHHWLAQTIRLPHKKASGEVESKIDMVFLPAPGRHFFFDGWRLMWLDISQTEPKDRMDGNKIYESATLWTFGRSPTLIQNFFNQIREEYQVEWKEDTVEVYVNQGMYWEFSQNLVPRPASSLFLRKGLWEDILSDARSFLDGREWYLERSIPWRRGFLFHGVPGTGKTVTAVALASTLRLPIYVVNLTSTNDSTLSMLLSKISGSAIVLMEDIDATAPKQRQQKGNDDEDQSSIPNLTLSGLLNALDGAVAGEGRILCMTTNHVEKLDPALIRPGRVDRRLEIGVADLDMATRFVSTFFKIPIDDLANQASIFVGQPIAVVQEHCLRYRDNWTLAVLNWDKKKVEEGEMNGQ